VGIGRPTEKEIAAAQIGPRGCVVELAGGKPVWTILMPILVACLSALLGYFLGNRQSDDRRKREQWWRVYLDLRIMEGLHSKETEKMPEDVYLKHWRTHRDSVLQNLVRSELPEMEAIIRAMNPALQSLDLEVSRKELNRLGRALLDRIDPKYSAICHKLEREYPQLHEGDLVSPEMSRAIKRR
jgi:hypothetical protein